MRAAASVTRTFCPDWCLGEHEQALEEGCTPHEAAVHTSADRADRLNELVNHHTGDVIRPGGPRYSLRVRADGDDMFAGLPTVDLEIEERRGEEQYVGIDLHMTGGEARTMARLLEHYADLADLHT